MSAVIFAGVLAGAALIYLCVNRLLAPRYLPALKVISPVTLTPLAVVFALLTGFLASNVWLHFERAQGLVVREAGELARILRMARNLPEPAAARLALKVRLAERVLCPGVTRAAGHTAPEFLRLSQRYCMKDCVTCAA